MVYVIFRRGNWMHTALTAACGERVAHACAWLTHRLVRRSWMQCGVLFTRPCKPDCKACVDSQRPAARKVHTVMVTINAALGFVCAIDMSLADPDKWIAVKVPRMSDDDAWKYFHKVASAGFNARGWQVNFFPSFMRLFSPPVQEAPKSFFCSELATTFLQTRYAEELAELTPCTTTPQMLFTTLLAHLPDLPQLCLDANLDVVVV